MKRKAGSIPSWWAASMVFLVCGVLALWALSARSAFAQDGGKEPVTEEPVPEKPVIEERARRILQDMGNYLKTAKQFTVHSEVTFDEVLASGQKLQLSASNDVAVRRPNRLWSDRKGDVRNMRFWYDGKSMTLLETTKNLYATFPAPSRIDAALDKAMKTYGVSAPVADLMYSDPYTTLMEHVKAGFYVGLHSVDGVRCHHLAFSQETIDWQIWIEDGKQLVPRKIVITHKTQPGSPQHVAVLSKWDFSVRLPDRLFIFEPPEGAEQIEIEKVDENKK